MVKFKLKRAGTFTAENVQWNINAITQAWKEGRINMFKEDCKHFKKEDITGWHGDVFDHPEYKCTCDGEPIFKCPFDCPKVHAEQLKSKLVSRG